MFTGIVRAIGTIAQLESRGGDLRLVIDAGALDLHDVAIGDSVCVAGVCLTAVDRADTTFAVDVSLETLSCTTLAALALGDFVNLEKALRLSDRLEGHCVSGHVDAVGRIVSIKPDARSQRWTLDLPDALARYVAAKGSICVDGVSLTVNSVSANRFSVNLIPHTIAATTFQHRRAGDRVNIEVDLIARYVERLTAATGDPVGIRTDAP